MAFQSNSFYRKLTITKKKLYTRYPVVGRHMLRLLVVRCIFQKGVGWHGGFAGYSSIWVGSSPWNTLANENIISSCPEIHKKRIWGYRTDNIKENTTNKGLHSGINVRHLVWASHPFCRLITRQPCIVWCSIIPKQYPTKTVRLTSHHWTRVLNHIPTLLTSIICNTLYRHRINLLWHSHFL